MTNAGDEMTEPKIDTPRTDDEVDDARNFALYFECRSNPVGTDIPPLVVSATFACQLERELAAKDADLLTRIQNYDRVIQAVATAMGGVCCGGIDVDGPGSTKDVLVDGVERLVVERDSYKAEYLELNKRFDAGIDKALEESRATVARLLLEANKFHDDCHEYEITGSCECINGAKSDCAFKEFLASLPDQAKRDAAVLRAAEEWTTARMNLSDYMESADCDGPEITRGVTLNDYGPVGCLV